MGDRPTHTGNVTVKKGDKWEKIGECVAWVNGRDTDKESVSGTLTVDSVKYNFRAWKGQR